MLAPSTLRRCAAFALVALAALVPAARLAAQASDPPVTRIVDNYGASVDVRIYPLAAGQPVMPPITIAQRYGLWSGNAARLQTAIDVPMRCTIAPTGVVSTSSCEAVGLEFDDPVAVAARNRIFYASPEFPAYPPVSEADDARIGRRVAFTVRVDPADRPSVDLDSGELVERRLFPRLFAITERDYPSRALRDEIGGRLDVECQVQADLSLICRTIGSDPPEFAGYFTGWAERRSRSATVAAKLTDGRPADGKRVRFPVNFMLPD